jgi:hypothetical protein
VFVLVLPVLVELTVAEFVMVWLTYDGETVTSMYTIVEVPDGISPTENETVLALTVQVVGTHALKV